MLAVGIGVVRRDRVRSSFVHVQAEDFAQQCVQVLSISFGGVAARADIIGRAAIAHAHVKIALGTERNPAAVVIPIGLVNFENDTFRSGRRQRSVLFGHAEPELAKAHRVVPIRGCAGAPGSAIDDVELAVGLELRV